MGEILYVGDRCFLRHDDGTITDASGRKTFTADEIWPPQAVSVPEPVISLPASADVVFPITPDIGLPKIDESQIVVPVKERRKRGPNKKKITRKPRKVEMA